MEVTDADRATTTMDGLLERIRELEEKLEKLLRDHKCLHEAFVKMYEDQRRRERVL
jgi:hypothetical protein